MENNKIVTTQERRNKNMCSFCGWVPCHSACPYAPEPKPIHSCKFCNEGIFHGDDVLKVEDDYYHLEDCAHEAVMNIILKKLDAKICEAKNTSNTNLVHTCKYCGEDILDEDDSLKVEDDYYHLEDCAHETAMGIILKNLDAKICKAE